MTTDTKDRPSAAELMALVDAYAETAAVNGIRSQWAQMARGRVELVLKQLPAPQAQADARDASRCGKWLTVVYQNVQPGDEAREIGSHPKVSALSWSHALNDRDAAIAAAKGE